MNIKSDIGSAHRTGGQSVLLLNEIIFNSHLGIFILLQDVPYEPAL